MEEALHLHQEVIARFGGTPGIRDPGLLESCLARPRSGHYSSLSEQAAALMQSLARNHAFADGNKRMAFALTAVFLLMNRSPLKVAPDQSRCFVVGRVIAAQADLQEFRDWIEAHLRRLQPVPSDHGNLLWKPSDFSVADDPGIDARHKAGGKRGALEVRKRQLPPCRPPPV